MQQNVKLAQQFIHEYLEVINCCTSFHSVMHC